MKSVLLAAMMASVLVVGFAAPAVPVVHAEEEWCSVC